MPTPWYHVPCSDPFCLHTTQIIKLPVNKHSDESKPKHGSHYTQQKVPRLECRCQQPRILQWNAGSTVKRSLLHKQKSRVYDWIPFQPDPSTRALAAKCRGYYLKSRCGRTRVGLKRCPQTAPHTTRVPRNFSPRFWISIVPRGQRRIQVAPLPRSNEAAPRSERARPTTQPLHSTQNDDETKRYERYECWLLLISKLADFSLPWCSI